MSHMDLSTAASIVAKSTSLFTPSQRQIEASSQVGYHDQPSADAPKVRAARKAHTPACHPNKHWHGHTLTHTPSLAALLLVAASAIRANTHELDIIGFYHAV
jgi:hypothetical protein